jgi:formylglycine-generating enzyme required for sulfatase activity
MWTCGLSPEVERYLDDAVRFSSRQGRSIRVAHTLVTCATAAAVLNELGVPAELEAAYRYVNVYNPACPLVFNKLQQRWTCELALAQHPVWGINWAGAVLICQHMGGRVPFESEWECFASNDQPSRIYPWGDAPPTPVLANFGEYFGGTSRVCSFPPSDLGLYDLAGNLCEWCNDFYRPAGGQRSSFERVVKGGAWSKDERHLKVAASRGKWERLGTTTIGFRPVWDD